LAGKSPKLRPNTVYIYGSGQPYIHDKSAVAAGTVSAFHLVSLQLACGFLLAGMQFALRQLGAFDERDDKENFAAAR
jgi:hypothetical protein